MVWLTAPVETIAQRMEGDASSTDRRPSLTGLPPREEIEQLLQKRGPLYAQAASLTVETSGKSVDAIVNEILGQLSLTGAGEAGR